MSPIRIEEENLFPNEIKEYHKKPIKIGELIQLHKTKTPKKYNPIKNSGEEILKPYTNILN